MIARLTACLAVGVMLGSVAPGVLASANVKRISVGKASLVGDELLLYHTQPGVPGGSEVSVRVGGEPCSVADRRAFQPRSGGDALTVLFVLDRGGSKDSGMGLYSDAVIEAIDEFTERALARDPNVRFAIVDAPGAKSPSSSLRPTGDKAKIKGFLEGLKGPAGSGADVYGTGVTGLSVLEQHADTPLRTLVLISDGIDPTKKQGTADNPAELVRQSKVTSIPVSAIHIDRDRSGRSPRHIEGAKTLRRVSAESRGVFRSVEAGKELRRKLVGELNALAEDYGKLVRTDCRLCGESTSKRIVPIEMVVRDSSGEVIARTFPDKVVELQMPVKNFGECVAPECEADEGCSACERCKGGKCEPRSCTGDGDCGEECSCGGEFCVIEVVNPKPDPGPSAEGESDACDGDADCPSCDECVDEVCEPLSCEVDADCPDSCSCEDGGCKSQDAAGGLPWLPLLAGLFALLTVSLLAVAARKRRSAAEHVQQRERSGAEAKLEAERAARIKAEREARNAASKTEIQSLESEIGAMKVKNARVRITGLGAIAFESYLEPGTYVLGASPGEADLVVEHSSVSGRHAELTVERDGGMFLRDLGSTNGTYIEADDTRGDPMPVTGDVELTFGDTIRLSKRVMLKLERP